MKPHEADPRETPEHDRREAVTAADDTGLVLQQEQLAELAFETPVEPAAKAKPRP